jgi:hypothetical protein
MSFLIDVIAKTSARNQVLIGGRWFMAKPYGKDPLSVRFRNAIRVITGKSRAYHYRSDCPQERLK